MDENNNIQNQEIEQIQEPENKGKKKGNPGLVLGIIGTVTGTLALLIVLFGGFFNILTRERIQDKIMDNRDRIIEQRQDKQDGGRFKIEKSTNEADCDCDFCE